MNKVNGHVKWVTEYFQKNFPIVDVYEYKDNYIVIYKEDKKLSSNMYSKNNYNEFIEIKDIKPYTSAKQVHFGRKLKVCINDEFWNVTICGCYFGTDGLRIQYQLPSGVLISESASVLFAGNARFENGDKIGYVEVT